MVARSAVRWSLTIILTAAVASGLTIVGYRAVLKRKLLAHPAISPVATFNAAAPAAPQADEPGSTIIATASPSAAIDPARYSTALNLLPQQWSPGTKQFAPVEPVEIKPADVLPPPTDAELAQLVERHPLVRPLPYPYYVGLCVPSDCCATSYGDVFYTHSLLSRQYGLDWPSSFFPYTSVPDAAGRGVNLGLFNDDTANPLTCPIMIEGQPIDAWPLFLTHFYRGWLDHIHTWSSEAAPPVVSYVAREAIVATGDQPVERTLAVDDPHAMQFAALELQLALQGDVKSWELTLVDRGGLEHLITYGAPLAGRAGWDLSNRSIDELKQTILFLNDEQNRSHQRFLGRPGKAFTSAKFKLSGANAASVEIVALRSIDLTRSMVAAQIEQMRAYNIRPIVSTVHGGFTSWASVQEGNLRFPFRDVKSGQDVIFDRPTHGAFADSPLYIADLFRQFGLIHYNRTFVPDGGEPDVKTTWSNKFARATEQPIELADKLPVYESLRYASLTPFEKIKPITPAIVHTENLGSLLARALSLNDRLGRIHRIYTHFNIFNAPVLSPAEGTARMSDLKRWHPHTDTVLRLISDLKYDLSGQVQPYQRVWPVSISQAARFEQTLRKLAEQTTVEGSRVEIEPWTDEVTRRAYPDSEFVTQDLHGQTIYVANADQARVFVDSREITSLKRNPPDLTGRPSVTIVDVHQPTIVFDELDLYEQSGRVVQQDANYYFQQREARSGQYSLEVQSSGKPVGTIQFKPLQLTNHETSFLRFSYKKTNPKSRVLVGWSEGDELRFVAAEGDRGGRQGWNLPQQRDTDYHEVVLDLADMLPAQDGTKVLPRGKIGTFAFGILDGAEGDSIFFDRVEFLAPTGLRPYERDQNKSQGGLVLGGRITPATDGVHVSLIVAGQERKTHTTRGGWYFFNDVPPEAIVELRCSRGAIDYYPARGRLIQAVRNDVEYHIAIDQPRHNLLPPPAMAGIKVPVEMALISTGSTTEHKAQYSAQLAPHTRRYYAGPINQAIEYVVDDTTNNYGYIDKDRRFAKTDDALRILLLGHCWEEGGQTLIAEHGNVLLESMLRRKLGRNVEVIVCATSNSSPGQNEAFLAHYGQRFKPDLVLLTTEMYTLTHIDGALQRKLVGWDRDHAPYQMVEFDAKGKLFTIPPDANYPAFTVPPDYSPLFGNLPPIVAYAATTELPDSYQRSFDLLRAVLAEKYVAAIKPYGGRVGLIYGYVASDLPQYQTLTPGSPAVCAQRWFDRVDQVCREAGVLSLNLADVMPNLPAADHLVWKRDTHLTPVGHYVIARALTEKLLAIPELKWNHQPETRLAREPRAK